MNNVERIDGQFMTAWGLRAGASLYEADPPVGLSSPGGNLTPLANREQYRSVYAHHDGSIDYDDLQTLIEKTLVLPDAEFQVVARREVVIDDYLVYLAMMAALQNHDSVRKNFYMYRDIQATVSAGWRFLPWDLDLTLGHLWSEENDVFEEAIVTDGNIFVGVRMPEFGGFFNQLTDRMLGIPAYRARFRGMLDHVVAASLARPYVERLVSNALCRATPDLVADSNKRAPNAEYLSRIAELYSFIEGRAQYVRSQAGLDGG
jgi:spore coat protein CotH